ncbi:hypothetical protein [Photobacterium iliopiscarium]|uniref:Uncharacterized protein n=1 Tax=Photobacterium iliopiscarium TaxID=56192 RepID=A0A2T3MF66_9GAMM|nr:hypothetical protein [Photobacterium iliopiscarium]PSV92418.1 hypothetical protein C9I88_16345 [Photobacterium iliopiscarium]
MAFFKRITNSEYKCHICNMLSKPWSQGINDGDDIKDAINRPLYSSEVFVCNSCQEKQDKINSNVISKSKEVKTYSHRYQGKVPTTTLEVASPAFKDKDETENYLKIFACLNGSSVVTELEFEKKVESEMNFNKKGKHTGEYKYSVWSAKGRV